MEVAFTIVYFSLIAVYFFFENIFSGSYKDKKLSMSLVNSSNNPTARLRKDPSVLDIIGEDNPKYSTSDIIGDDYEKEKSNDVPSFVDANSEEWKKAKAELKEIQRNI